MILVSCLVLTALLQSSASHSDLSVFVAPPYWSRLPENGDYVGNGSHFGQSVAATDVNGDGIKDILTGSPYMEPSGGVYVFDGATRRVMFLYRFDPTVASMMGRDIATIDLDSDGKEEVIVSSGLGFIALESAVETFKVRKKVDIRVYGLSTGDFNGDGIGDVVIISRDAPTGAGFVYFGPDLEERIEVPALNSQHFPEQVEVGDLNQDGVDDVVCSADYAEAEGRVWYALGPNFELAYEIEDPEPRRSSEYGYRIDVGDVTGDGFPEVLATSMRNTCPGGGGDICRDCLVFFGPDYSTYRQVANPDLGFYGHGVRAIFSDVNGDGFQDVFTYSGNAEGVEVLVEYHVHFGPSLDQVFRFHRRDWTSLDLGGNALWVGIAKDLEGDGREEVLSGNINALTLGKQYPGPGVVDVFDFTSAIPFANYGYGSSGTGGETPTIDGIGTGEKNCFSEIHIDNARGGALGCLWIGMRMSSERLFDANQSFSGVLPFQRVLPETTIPFVLSGAPGSPGTGHYKYRLFIPDEVALLWERIYVQGAIMDPETPWDIAVTPGLRISIQP